MKYVISNYNDAILDALKAIEIVNLKEKYTFIYDSVFKQLDGFCYSFKMNTNLFSTNFIKNKQKCKFLGDNKRCTTQNISCKLLLVTIWKKLKVLI